MVLVELVAGKEEQVGIAGQDVVGDRSVGERVVVLAGEPRQPQRPPGGIRADRSPPFVLRFAAVGVPLAVDEPERRRHALVPGGQAERRRPGVAVEFGEAVGPPLPAVLRQQLDPPVVVGAQRRQQRCHLDDEALVAARVAHGVHRPQDRPEAAVLIDFEGIPVHRPLAEPVPGALALRDLPIEVADDGDVAGDVRGGHGVHRHTELGSVGRNDGQFQGAATDSDYTVENEECSFRVDPLADVDLLARCAQHQAPADHPGVYANAAREAVAAMVVDDVADTDPEACAAVALPGFHPPATNRRPESPLLAGQSMRE